MADSDHTRIHAAVTRRKALKATAAGMMSVPFQIIGPVAEAGAEQPDPALALWRDWQAVHHQTDALCRQQQHLEALLMRTIGFPRVMVELDDDGTAVILSQEDDIEDLLDDNPALAGACIKAKLEFAARQARWAEADALVGYSSARREELAAADQAQQLIDALTVTPATTLAGVAGKLDMILREGQTSEDCEEFPWREIRLALLDLVQIGQSLWPDSFMPSKEPMEP
ncbi:hypothetical protein [Paracoccus saliphilus]|uniref:Uncharacterized protein n=1 Tax=Paracoccus saliphilus TaxID=405559 RepID=A0AA46A778_9RHOB|nr:hypothetical protein [Paracoccus saliphilus]WCR02709.1 hypothetical protein JHX88_17990 [Paracoccus saliphilus]SIT09400.1 hypothetical protein SAMN05421772_11757 [Paracoccus saliphilus]